MKRAFAVTLLLMLFASVALADGPDLPPVNPTKLPTVVVVLLADGGGLPPNCTIVNWKVICQQPPQADAVLLADGPDLPPNGNVAKPAMLGVVLLADGPDIPPISTTTGTVTTAPMGGFAA
jgi:hypothetical protein